MASNIDDTVPGTGADFLSSPVRTNFVTAKSEISALQAALVIGTTVQAWDADLTTWAGITPGANVGTFLATPSSANLAAAVTGETGSGALVFGTSPTIATPSIDTINLTGGQIAFPATQAASAGANTLDDYEEGTWTPTIEGTGASSGQAYTTQLGVYTKIGRVVTAMCDVKLSTKGTITAGIAIVKGLPFAAALVGDGNAVGTVTWFSGLATNWISITGANIYTSTSVSITGRTAATPAAAADALADTDISNTTNFRMFFSYHV